MTNNQREEEDGRKDKKGRIRNQSRLKQIVQVNSKEPGHLDKVALLRWDFKEERDR